MALTKVTYAMIDGTPVNVLDFGAVGDGTANDSAAVQAAINTGKSVVFPEGTYAVGNLTQSTAAQRFYGVGNAVLRKNANGIMFSATGRGIICEGIKFDGNVAFTGDCVKTTGDNCVFNNCSIWTKNGFALLAEGNGTRILGTSDIYYSDDAAGYAICLGNTSADTLYHQIVGISTSTSVGGILCRRTGASNLVASQIGAIDLSTGQLSIDDCRITGALTIARSFTQVDNTLIAGNVTIGNGADIISGIGFGPNVFMQAGTTLTLNTLVRESGISTAQLIGTTVVDNLTGTAGDIDNVMFSKPTAYTPAWTASVTNPVLGDGTLTGTYIRNGRTISVTVQLTLGASTTTGSGDWRISLPSTAQTTWIGSYTAVDTGTLLYAGISSVTASQAYAIFITNGVSTPVRSTVPFTWVAPDVLQFSLTYETT